jgi:transcriptional regulator with XRE-family HTH domain
MTRFKDRQLALELRTKQHLSYSQIKKQLHISKSTLSDWLSNYPLSKERIAQLRDKNEVRIEKFRETWRKKREKRLNIFYKHAHKELLPLTAKELLIAGLFLYWGEGSKSTYDKVCISNSDPNVIKFTLYWLINSLNVDKTEIKVYLQLYKDMNNADIIDYWSRELNINKNQFGKSYIKRNTRVNIDHKGFGYGTCNLAVNRTLLKEKVLMEIKALADYYSSKV